MPVDVGENASKKGGENQRDIGDRRGDTQLAGPVTFREVVSDKSRGKWDDHSGPDAQECADYQQQPQGITERVNHATSEEY